MTTPSFLPILYVEKGSSLSIAEGDGNFSGISSVANWAAETAASAAGSASAAANEAAAAAASAAIAQAEAAAAAAQAATANTIAQSLNIYQGLGSGQIHMPATSELGALQAAIKNFSASGGGKMFIPQGNYNLYGGALIMYPGVSLYGAGRNNDSVGAAKACSTTLNFEYSGAGSVLLGAIICRPMYYNPITGTLIPLRNADNSLNNVAGLTKLSVSDNSITDLSININIVNNTPGFAYAIYNKLGVNFTMHDVSITGYFANYAIKLWGTLYTRIFDYFILSKSVVSVNGVLTAICPGQQFDATYNDDLDGEGAGYNPITGVAAAYYGVNDSWIERGQCYGPGVSINYNGILHIRENDFENSAKNCLATIVISGPTPSFVDIVGNYGEMTNAQGATNPLCFLLLQTACTGEIGVNEVYGGNGVWDGDSAAINMNGSQFVGSIDTSAFNRWNKALIAGNSNQSSQWAYTGNYEDSTLRPNVQFDGGYPYINRALAAANNINLSNWGTLDFRYHRVRANRVDHAMPQSITAAGYPIMLQYSENIEINIGGTPIINCIEDAGKFPGTRVVICAMQPVVLAHNAKTAIHSVEIVEPGTLNPVLTITDSTPGTPLQAVGTVSIQNGVVTGAAVVSAPSGMIAPLSFSLAAYGFSSLSPTFSGTLDVNGNLTAITVTNGSSYGYQCTTVGGGGGRCVITANCVNGKLTGFNVASSDSNFTSAPGLVIPSSGSGVAPQGVVIRQAPFILAKGANCTILAGQAIAFYVNSAGQLVEIGNTSLSL